MKHIDCAFSFHLPSEFEIKTMKMEKDKRLCFGVRTHFLVIMLTEAWSHQKLTKIYEEKPKYTKWFAIVARKTLNVHAFASARSHHTRGWAANVQLIYIRNIAPVLSLNMFLNFIYWAIWKEKKKKNLSSCQLKENPTSCKWMEPTYCLLVV